LKTSGTKNHILFEVNSMNKRRNITIGMVACFMLVWVSGCVTVSTLGSGPVAGPAYDHGPPPWAPAHGYRAKHHYYYYPAAQVYFDPVRNVYFYPDQGRWNRVTKLPPPIAARANDYVVLDLDSDAPYEHHHAVVKKYPPGQLKKHYGKKKKWEDNDFD
jgi:hypothetical protein